MSIIAIANAHLNDWTYLWSRPGEKHTRDTIEFLIMHSDHLVLWSTRFQWMDTPLHINNTLIKPYPVHSRLVCSTSVGRMQWTTHTSISGFTLRLDLELHLQTYCPLLLNILEPWELRGCCSSEFLKGAVSSRLIYYNLHRQLLVTVVRATFRFHDTTPQGRMLNRFGKVRHPIMPDR